MVAVAVFPVEVTVAYSFADHRWCLIIESSYSFFTDLSFGGLELTVTLPGKLSRRGEAG